MNFQVKANHFYLNDRKAFLNSGEIHYFRIKRELWDQHLQAACEAGLTTVSTYVGSWYGDYFGVGSNWAADDFQAGYRPLTDAYRKTGFAGLTDWMTTGCFTTTSTDRAAANRLAGTMPCTCAGLTNCVGILV